MGRVKNLEEIKAMVRERTGKRNIFRRARREEVEFVLGRLTSKDPELWAAEWSRVAKPYEEEGAKLEKAGKLKEAREAYVMAYTYYTTGRYPVPHVQGKRECFRKSLELYEKAGRYFGPPLERVEVPYGNKTIPAYLRVRRGTRQPVVINFGGIDSFKAESYEYDEALQQAGLATCAVDMPGVGECPIRGSTTAESLYSAMIDYLEKRPEVDPKRIAILGRSFGGYWAAKMAFVEAKRLRAAVVWGGGVHYFFQENWLRESTNAESYLMDHDVARCMAFGVKTIDELAKIFPTLSLKTQGWLDKPSCPMLIVNGKEDLQTPIDDLYILLEYGTPKSARVFPGGHMGQTPETLPTIVCWLKSELQ
ncbi:MAG: alpha/beta hydrolase [Deltaproteobacteria bacterium]|nr:alpha/beta hydrolase [Deltaproteobacteria bacterium]MBI2210202.1 alpha/beta hydrolase [Deltaproteobacteria bacterium]MBI2347819.1 alpha/beta hydrolase [Deltaproteobacteria bacterium]MBI2539134.1 alpha/beta hydrolase [Deltaproteobacteria bacterium]MBI2991100.1 alpha/beta hydrolase [Deltaproteobacteria bacterium]